MTRTGEYNVSPPQNRADNKNGSVIQDSNRVETIENEDNNVAEVDNYVGYGFKEDLSLWCRWDLPLIGTLRFNPVVSFSAIFIILTLVITCCVLPNLSKTDDDGNVIIDEKTGKPIPLEVPFDAWKTFIVDKFTWLYIGSQDLWAVFAIVLYFSKYADIKLGKPNDKPEYNDVTWFVMLFACGIGVGLFFYGVAEPIFHYTGKNRYTADPTTPDNTLAQIAINITLYHWGIHGWIVYCLVGLLLALMAYRENLPMTMKSCFYPLIGDKIFGWMGDGIDTISVMTTLFGVCTSLGLGTRQLNAGFNTVNSDIDADNLNIQIAIIWIITAIATVSTVSGVGMGIRRLSETCFGVGMFLMMVAMFMDKTFYILNLFVQSLGYYLQYIMQLGWHTDAFEQLGPSAHLPLGRFAPEAPAGGGATAEQEQPDGPEAWMDSWTMFYWGWWISWSPFVGMFIAKISRGRTIRQFINGTLTAPVLYSIFWMVIFGGAGLRHEREASNIGLCCPAKENGVKMDWFLSPYKCDEDGKNCLLDPDWPSFDKNDSLVDPKDTQLCAGGTCGSCAKSVLLRYSEANQNYTYLQFYNEYVDLGKDFGSTASDRSLSKLSCHSTEQMWFDVMRSYSQIGTFLAIFSLCGIVLYFVTSSDSGSLVIDCLSSNGDPDPPAVQRVFWAMMEGATATALLAAGGKKGLQALQSVSLISGLPYTFVICVLCVALWRAVKVAAGDLDPFGPQFSVGLFDCCFAQPLTKIRKDWKRASGLAVSGLINIFMAPWTVAKVAARLNKSDKPHLYAIVPVTCFVLFIVLHIVDIACDGCWAMAWFFYLCFATFLASIRIQCRERFDIIGNPFEDFFSALFLYPNVAVQLDESTKHLEVKSNKTAPAEMKMEEAGKVNNAFQN